MPFQPGQVANPGGLPKHSRQALTKIRKAIDIAIDRVKHGQVVGVVALAAKITEEIEASPTPSKILKDLAPLLPKDILIDAVIGTQSLTDAELQDIIANRAKERRQLEQTIEGQVIDISTDDDDTGTGQA